MRGRLVPTWTEHAIFWHVYPLGFAAAESTAAEAEAAGGALPAHRLGLLERWLDYAIDLGASGVALGPIFASTSHGYDTVDHYRIDPRLGDEADFAALIEATHERGLRVLLDGVFNHVGRDFPAFQEVLQHGPAAEHAGWFRLSWPGEWSPGAEPGYETFEGHHNLVALNHEEPAVVDHVVDVMRHWLAAGADGWRLDAAYAVPPAFWSRVLPRVRAGYPDAYLVGEVIHGDYPAIVRQTGMDSVTQYELWKAIWSSLTDRNFFELAWALDRHNAALDTFAPLTFLGNHDVTRIASTLPDSRHLAHALVVLLTVGGTPSIYYGDEQGFHGVKEDRAGGDDAIRPAFPGRGPADLAPYGWPVYRLHQRLIGLRRRHPWLHRARTRVLRLTNTGLAYESTAQGQRLVTLLNLTDDPFTAPAPGVGALLAGKAEIHQPGGPDTQISVPGQEWCVAAG
jgi:cyclomaltodextrinase